MKWKNIPNEYTSKLNALKKSSPREILGVGGNASPDEIKKAYKEKVKIYHPDSSDTFMREFNEEVLKLINNAYAELIR